MHTYLLVYSAVSTFLFGCLMLIWSNKGSVNIVMRLTFMLMFVAGVAVIAAGIGYATNL